MSITSSRGRRRPDALRCIACSLIVGSLIAAAAPSASATEAAAAPSAVLAGLEIRDAWIRWLPAGLPAAGYMTLINRGHRPLELISVSSDAYRQIDMHRSVTRDGMSRMEPVTALSVPAGGTLRFAAAGYHLMLMQPTRTLAPGTHVSLTLQFAGGAARTVRFEVRGPNGSASSSESMPGMGDMHAMPGMPATPPR